MWTPLATFQECDLFWHATVTFSFTQNFKLRFGTTNHSGREWKWNVSFPRFLLDLLSMTYNHCLRYTGATVWRMAPSSPRVLVTFIFVLVFDILRCQKLLMWNIIDRCFAVIFDAIKPKAPHLNFFRQELLFKEHKVLFYWSKHIREVCCSLFCITHFRWSFLLKAYSRNTEI